jgi:uncharacterized membrane protein HdeD (DUF308 family)
LGNPLSLGEDEMSDLAEAAKRGGGNMKMFGILTMILGLFVMMVPGLMGMSMLWLVGLMVAVAGVFRMMWAFTSESLGGGMFVFAIGVLTLLAGLAVMGNPLFASGMVTLILVGYLLLDGITEIMASFSLRPEPGSGWMLFGGIVSVLLGIMLWRQFPLSGAWALGLFLGIKMLFSGMMMVTVGSAVRRMGKAAAS